jgi:hypothetical protein
MVVAAELGYLETLIQLALPDHHLKFRSLAREGDTVFEQRRDLNYPKLEDQLDKIGATVVICQFGQMESLMAMGDAPKDKRDEKDAKDAGKADVPLVPSVPAVPENADATRKAKIAEFVAAYEKLIARLKGKDGKRRIVILNPPMFSFWVAASPNNPRAQQRADMYREIAGLAGRVGAAHVEKDLILYCSTHKEVGLSYARPMGDDTHRVQAGAVGSVLAPHNGISEFVSADEFKPLGKMFLARQLITAKNRLWYYYYRPQNWAFLAGDRTNQPSSRDHLDPSKRWFPEELEKFVPLIDAKDAEIWALAKKLSAQGGK